MTRSSRSGWTETAELARWWPTLPPFTHRTAASPARQQGGTPDRSTPVITQHRSPWDGANVTQPTCHPHLPTRPASHSKTACLTHHAFAHDQLIAHGPAITEPAANTTNTGGATAERERSHRQTVSYVGCGR